VIDLYARTPMVACLLLGGLTLSGCAGSRSAAPSTHSSYAAGATVQTSAEGAPTSDTTRAIAFTGTAEPPPPSTQRQDGLSRNEQLTVRAFDQAIEQQDLLSRDAAPRCPAVCDLADTICGLSTRICVISARHPEFPALRDRCDDGRARCDRARGSAQECGCAD
jgi:hypothetical protein